ncbi:putative membrane protein, partial [Escherichia coli 1-110-08_S3_C3]
MVFSERLREVAMVSPAEIILIIIVLIYMLFI